MATSKDRFMVSLAKSAIDRLKEAEKKHGKSKSIIIQELIDQHIDENGGMVISASDALLARAEKEIDYLKEQADKKDKQIAMLEQEIRNKEGIEVILREIFNRLPRPRLSLPKWIESKKKNHSNPRSHTESDSSSE